MSDIDGTLVHYAKDFTHHGVKLVSSDEKALTAIIEGPNGDQRHCRLLPSATMGPACISERTIQLVEAIRDRGHVLCLDGGEEVDDEEEIGYAADLRCRCM